MLLVNPSAPTLCLVPSSNSPGQTTAEDTFKTNSGESEEIRLCKAVQDEGDQTRDTGFDLWPLWSGKGSRGWIFSLAGSAPWRPTNNRLNDGQRFGWNHWRPSSALSLPASWRQMTQLMGGWVQPLNLKQDIYTLWNISSHLSQMYSIWAFLFYISNGSITINNKLWPAVV